jgi:hypothetical protein
MIKKHTLGTDYLCKKLVVSSWVMVAHICNPSYLGGLWFKANSLKTVHETLSQNSFPKKGWESGSSCRF